MRHRPISAAGFTSRLAKGVAVAFGAVCLIGPLLAQETTTYTYDALGRLTATNISGSANGGVQTSTGFDPAGNRTSYAVSGAASTGNNVTLSIGSTSTTEGNQLIFTVTKSGVATSNTTVNFATSNGSASAGSDYNATTGTLTFAPSETTKTIAVSTIDDATNEASETFSLSLSGASGAAISAGTGTGTINDNDAAPSFSISNAGAVTEGGTLTFTVTKSGATALTYLVNFGTANGTAIAGSDYSATSGSLTFAPGETSKTFSVSTINDAVYEPTESFSASLSGASGGATVGTSVGTGTINDNDPPPNQAPVAVNDYAGGPLSANCDYHSIINVTSNDYDPDNNTPLTLISATTSNPDSSYVYLASSSSIGIDAYASGYYYIQYQIRDTLGATATGTLTLTVSNNSSCQLNL